MAQTAVMGNVDLVRHVLGFCTDAPTLVAARKTCTLFRDAATDDVLRAAVHWRTLPRDLHPRLPPPRCVGCKTIVRGIPWDCVTAHCGDCRCITMLPLARPLMRQISMRHTHYVFPHIPHVKPILIQAEQDDGTWRDACATTGSLACRRGVGVRKRVRIAGRVDEQCHCSAPNPIACFHAGTCLWTPFGEAK